MPNPAEPMTPRMRLRRCFGAGALLAMVSLQAVQTESRDPSPLTGSAFLGNWNGLPLSDLQTRIRTTMPSDSVGIYDRQLVTDVIAYLLKANGFPAGQV